MKHIYLTILFFVFFLNISSNTTTILNHTHSETSISQSKDTIQYIRRILILGDSHFLGSFGEMFHRNLHETGQFDILSIAIGGAGSRNYTMTMRNNCCGYTIRESFHYENIPQNGRIRRVEGSNTLTGELVGKPYGGRIEKATEHIDPHIVIIALGHNFINDHQNLIDLIWSFNPNISIVWVGPFRNRGIAGQMKNIQSVVEKNKLFLIRSDDILGSDTAGCAHFYGKAAQNWADKVAQRMKPIIQNGISTLNSIKFEAASYKFDTVPFFLRYADDRLFQLFNNYEPEALEIISSLFPVEEFSFRPRYLNRMYSHFFSSGSFNEKLSDFEGNSYKSVQIGNSFWMAENLRTTYFRDGTGIKQQSNSAPSIRAPHYVKFTKTSSTNYKYNWHAVSNDKKICPTGWHIPDISEWQYLKQHLKNPDVFFTNSTSEHEPELFWLSNKVNDNTDDAWAAGYSHTTNSFIMVNKTAATPLSVRCVLD